MYILTSLFDNCNFFIDKFDGNCNTPLHYAAKHNRPSVTKLLIEYKAEVDRKGEDDMTPLHFACQYGGKECKEVIECLIKQNANIYAKDK